MLSSLQTEKRGLSAIEKRDQDGANLDQEAATLHVSTVPLAHGLCLVPSRIGAICSCFASLLSKSGTERVLYYFTGDGGGVHT
jgi:hypothetical protein